MTSITTSIKHIIKYDTAIHVAAEDVNERISVNASWPIALLPSLGHLKVH